MDYEIFILTGHTEAVESIAISHENKYIVSGSDDDIIDNIIRLGSIVSRSDYNTIRLWDLESGRLIRTFKGHTDLVTYVAISNDNKYIVSGSDDNTIKLWNIYDVKNIITIYSFADGWVCMTHDKYFDYGWNGKEYIYQRFKNHLKYFPITDKTFEKYHRPDFIKKRIKEIKTLEN